MDSKNDDHEEITVKDALESTEKENRRSEY